MARMSEAVKQVPAIFRYNTLNALMFGYVRGVRETLHTVTIEAALYMFMDSVGLTEDDFNIDSAKVIYNDMQNNLTNHIKSK